MSDTSVMEGDASVNAALLCPLLAFVSGLKEKWAN